MIITPHERKNLIARFPFTNESFAKMSRMPGFFRWEGRSVLFRPTPANVEFLIKEFPDAQWLEGTDDHIRILQERARIGEENRANKLHMDVEDDFDYKIKPWDHQRRAFLISRDREAFALLMEQRTGKTKVILDNAAWLWKLGKIHTLIVVSVNGVHRNWVDNEIPTHLPDWCPAECFFSRSNHNKLHHAHFEKVLFTRDKLRIFTFHIEGLATSNWSARFKSVMGDGKGVFMVIDESTRIKNKSAQRTKFLNTNATCAAYRRILSGTPLVKDPLDIFSQFFWLDPDILGYDTVTSFKAHFCDTKKFAMNPATGKFQLVAGDSQQRGPSFEKIVGVKNADELTRLIDNYSIRVLRKDCSDMPAKVYKRMPVELSQEQKKLYKELLTEYIAEFKGHEVAAPLAMTRALRLQQITSNWWPMEEKDLAHGETWRNVQPIAKVNPRLEALKNILGASNGKVIIWARFRPDLQLIQAELGKAAVSYHGGISEEERARNYKRFQEDPSIMYFVGNQASAGLGLNLSVANTEVYYSNNFSLEQRLQSEDRPELINKKIGTLVWDLEAPGTMDSKVIKNLKGKKNMADIITGDPASVFLETLEEFNKEMAT